MRLLRIGLATFLLATALTPNILANHGPLPPPNVPTHCGPFPASPDLCPRPTPQGASCVSHGILVLEQDLTAADTTGDATVSLARSRAWTIAVPGMWSPLNRSNAQPPTDPNAHADASEAGATYTNAFLGLTVTAQTIFSQCDVVALTNGQGLFTESYGRGGAADVSITQASFAPPLLSLEVLDFEMDATGFPSFTSAAHACDVLEIDSGGPPLEVAHCPPPNTGFTIPLTGGTTVTVVQNEVWGPFPNAAGQWVYGGAALDITYLVPGVRHGHIYVGYVSVAVAGGPPTPAMWIPDMPSLALPCVPDVTC
ncbi:MAG: hypothetical protein ACT4PT_06390 [Methanobacteriota archaeon]